MHWRRRHNNWIWNPLHYIRERERPEGIEAVARNREITVSEDGPNRVRKREITVIERCLVPPLRALRGGGQWLSFTFRKILESKIQSDWKTKTQKHNFFQSNQRGKKKDWKKMLERLITCNWLQSVRGFRVFESWECCRQPAHSQCPNFKTETQEWIWNLTQISEREKERERGCDWRPGRWWLVGLEWVLIKCVLKEKERGSGRD